MDPYESFDNQLKEAALRFKAVDKKEIIRVVSHIDADGISSCA